MLAHMTVYTTSTSGHELCALQYANLACQSGKDPKQRNAKVAAPSGAQGYQASRKFARLKFPNKIPNRNSNSVLEFAFGNLRLGIHNSDFAFASSCMIERPARFISQMHSPTRGTSHLCFMLTVIARHDACAHRDRLGDRPAHSLRPAPILNHGVDSRL